MTQQVLHVQIHRRIHGSLEHALERRKLGGLIWLRMESKIILGEMTGYNEKKAHLWCLKGMCWWYAPTEFGDHSTLFYGTVRLVQPHEKAQERLRETEPSFPRPWPPSSLPSLMISESWEGPSLCGQKGQNPMTIQNTHKKIVQEFLLFSTDSVLGNMIFISIRKC